LIALLQISLLSKDERMEIHFEDLEPQYERWQNDTRSLLKQKNHDYVEAWREMRSERSMTV